MRYFTDNPLERMMMQVPRQERGPDLSLSLIHISEPTRP